MSRFCMSCGAEMPDHAGFCPKCGARVKVPRCPTCGKEVDFGVDFCMYCGTRVTEEPIAAIQQEQEELLPKDFQSPEEPQPEEDPRPQEKLMSAREEYEPMIAPEPPSVSDSVPAEENKRYTLAGRNPSLSHPFRWIENDVILLKDSAVIGEPFGEQLLGLREIPYADMRCIELKWYMPTSMLLFCIVFTLITITAFILPSAELWTLLVGAIFTIFFWRIGFRYNIIISKKDGTQECIAGQKKAYMEVLRKDLQDRLNMKATSDYTGDLSEFVVKKTTYYQQQFANAKWGEKVKFNWAAFFFTGMFCYYRKSGKIFWQIYRSYLLLSVATIAGIGVALTSALKPGADIIYYLWSILVLTLLQGIYGLICNIRLGRQFNTKYYKRCIFLAESGVADEKKKGTSVGKAILFSVVLAVCMTLIGGAIGAVAAGSLMGSNDWDFSDILLDNPGASSSSERYYGDDRDVVGHWEFYSMTDGINTWTADEVGVLAATSLDVFSGDAVVIGAIDTETNVWTEVTATWAYSDGQFKYWMNDMTDIGELDSGMLTIDIGGGEALTFRRQSNIAWGATQRKAAAERVLQGEKEKAIASEPATPTQTPQKSSEGYEYYVNDSADCINDDMFGVILDSNKAWDEKYGSIVAVSTKHPGALGPFQEENIPDVMWDDMELSSKDMLIHAVVNEGSGEIHWYARFGTDFPLDVDRTWGIIETAVDEGYNVNGTLQLIFSAMEDLYSESWISNTASSHKGNGTQEQPLVSLWERVALDKFHLEYVYSGDWEKGGEWKFVVEYQWTNTTNDAITPLQDISITASQDDVGLIINDYGYSSLVMPGETITDSVSFSLNDMTTDIIVKVEDDSASELFYLAPISGISYGGSSYIEGDFESV